MNNSNNSNNSKKYDLICHFDGSCNPNPGGVMGYGFYILEDGVVIHSDSKIINERTVEMIIKIYLKYNSVLFDDDYKFLNESMFKNGTNNKAEYISLINLLLYLKKNKLENKSILICGDSRLVINQVLGTYNINDYNLRILNAVAYKLFKSFKDIKLQWVSGDSNGYADFLSKKSL